ncbi:cytochrome P450 [Epithele typhae]|uniref:cytochrome P450 n=1 Tax=Epithele typhae TaxID=378194 RepID=UPI0020086443|nr:cytochrome P450 [Epithele typhae]KAH9929104.1 cytochrome P450 [Epithele typhae]
MSQPGISLLNWSGAVLCIAGVSYAISAARWYSRSRGLPLPPGPKGLPILGNVFDLPMSWPWIAYQQLGLVHGDVIHFRALGQSVIVLNSAAAISEYLDKHTANTADRAQSLMVELTGNGHNLGLMRYGQRWRDHRRVFWQYFHRDAARSYQQTQRAVAHIFLEKLLASPLLLEQHIRYAFAGSVIHVAYGIDYTSDASDKYSDAMRTAIVSIVDGLVPGKFMVQYFPFLRHLPSWLPGTGWQRQLAQWREENHSAITMPYEYARNEMNHRKDVNESMVGRHINSLTRAGDVSAQDEEILKNTNLLSLHGGFLALSLYPEVVKKAQEELDVVVGPHRLPAFDDEPSLVYVKAVIMEIMRWHNVLPLGVAHGTTNDDTWRGWFIPAGTLIQPNVWACMNDPQMFPNPREFCPERFIKDGAIDTPSSTPWCSSSGTEGEFGGETLRRAGLFINIASVLHVFDISGPLDANGKR